MAGPGSESPQGIPGPREIESLLREAVRITEGGRQIILARLRDGFQFRRKADRSYVTEVDLAVEDYIRGQLARSFPEHGAVGEEFPELDRAADYQWIIDPIDGTLSFRHRIPLFGSLLALLFRGIPIVGVIDLPALGRCYSGALGHGAFCNGARIGLRDLEPGESLEDEIVATGDRAQFEKADQLHLFDALMTEHPCVRTYTDCFGHALAIEGTVGAMVDFDLRFWDFAPSQLLVTEAGGRFVCLNQPERFRSDERYHIVMGKPRMVEWLTGKIRGMR